LSPDSIRGDPTARFYLDEDIPPAAASAGAALGLDIVAARDAQPLLPQDDVLHLHTAGRQQRVLVTYNRNDFLLATRDAFTTGAPHAGLVILTHRLPRDPGRIAGALVAWVRRRRKDGAWPMQPYEMAFLSR
jgi:hypothetical protein